MGGPRDAFFSLREGKSRAALGIVVGALCISRLVPDPDVPASAHTSSAARERSLPSQGGSETPEDAARAKDLIQKLSTVESADERAALLEKLRKIRSEHVETSPERR